MSSAEIRPHSYYSSQGYRMTGGERRPTSERPPTSLLSVAILVGAVSALAAVLYF